MSQDDVFVKAFGPISADYARVSTAVAAFKAGVTGFAYVDVDESTRREFIDAVRVAASTIREAVEVVIRDVLVSQVAAARGALDSLKERWGDWTVVWTDATLPQVSYSGCSTLSGADLLEYENAVDRVILTIEPYVSALKLETVVLPRTAFRMGFDEPVSLLSALNDKKGKLTSAGKAIDSLGYETASMILSRMLMVRFAEDHGLLKHYICNGGIEQFSRFAEHFNIGAQGLLREVYRKARDLYSSVFSAEALDWAVQGDDPTLSDALMHAMWLLSRWNFKTVKGDILAGVYDKYLDVAKRRALGEVYTRPEICRYMLSRCDAKPADTVLDPACGSGTFLVEHLHEQLERLRASNALNVEAVQSVLQRIHGLDINPFSVVLSQIQMLWQLLDVFAYLTPDEQKNTAKALIPHIMIEGGHTSLDTYDQPMEVQGERELDLGQADTGGAKFSGAFGAQVRRRLKAIATAQYDVVVANPPYVRAHRLALDERTRRAYHRIMFGQVDLYCMFLYRTLRTWLKPEARTAFIIPIAALEAGYAEGLRSVIAEYRILEIVDLEALRKLTFRGVKKQTIIVVLQNVPATDDDLVTVRIAGVQCYDSTTDEIDLTKATSSQIKRKHLLVSSYFGGAAEEEAPEGVSE